MLSVAVLVAKRQKEGRCSQLSSSYLLLRVQFRFLQSQILVIDREATVIGLLDWSFKEMLMIIITNIYFKIIKYLTQLSKKVMPCQIR